MHWLAMLYCKPCGTSTAHIIRLIIKVNGFYHLTATCQIDGCGNHYNDWVNRCEFLELLEAKIGKLYK